MLLNTKYNHTPQAYFPTIQVSFPFEIQSEMFLQENDCSVKKPL